MEQQKKQNMKNHSLESNFIPYEQALALKELGFNEPCLAKYANKDKGINLLRTDWDTLFINTVENNNGPISAPLYQQAFKWFREKHGMHNAIGFNGKWYYDIDSMKNTDQCVHEVGHKWDMDTYEKAEQACLEKLIEIVKQK